VTIEKYCIIGGGLGGVGIGKCFSQGGIDFEIIEQEDDFGGNWYASKPCSRMYQSTHLISSKTNSQFSDFPMPADYPVYPRHELVLKYIRSVAKQFDLYKRTNFGLRVQKIVPEDRFWQVQLSNGEARTYKGVLIANGQQREPLYANYPGKFQGDILHSAQYYSPAIFEGKKVLVIGAGNSGCDIAVDGISRAEKLFHSTRRGYHYFPKFIHGMATQDWLFGLNNDFKSKEELEEFIQKTFKDAGFDGTDYGLPAPDHGIFECHPIMNSQILYHIGHGDIVPKGDVARFEGNVVFFVDGTREKIDLVLYATGYRSSFPFLGEDIFHWDSRLSELFLRSFHRKHDRLIFCGHINAPAGFGNLINTMGVLLVAYLKALDRETSAIQKFRRLKLGANPPVARAKFIQTPRHDAEVDLWQLLEFLTQLRIQFEKI
jgi:thioredoxin reductase